MFDFELILGGSLRPILDHEPQPVLRWQRCGEPLRIAGLTVASIRITIPRAFATTIFGPLLVGQNKEIDFTLWTWWVDLTGDR